jgi:putative endonuclease
MWIVYVLKSQICEKRYVGMTQEIVRRLAEHNSGKSKFTSGFMPWSVMYTECFGTAAEAPRKRKIF